MTPKRYAYEFNRRWDRRVPRHDITWLVRRLHVGTSTAEVEELIRQRCKDPRFTPKLIEQSVAYALIVHEQNRTLYQRVMG